MEKNENKMKEEGRKSRRDEGREGERGRDREKERAFNLLKINLMKFFTLYIDVKKVDFYFYQFYNYISY